jgi:hypothetical protein
MVKAASFGGLFLSLVGTSIVWAGVDTFKCPTLIWKASLILNLIVFSLAWLFYLPFRNTNSLLGHGLLAFIMLLTSFWLFGFSMFYFYFLFAPLDTYVRAAALASITATLLYRAYLITTDISEEFQKNKTLFNCMYHEGDASITYNQDAFGLLQKTRKDRNPFKSLHAYAAMIVTPIALILNRLLSPFLGEGHGVFIVAAFFAVPILLWGVELFVQTIITMLYYPFLLQHRTGKPVLMKDR